MQKREGVQYVRLSATIGEPIEAAFGQVQRGSRTVEVAILAGEQGDMRQRTCLKLRVARSAVEKRLLPAYSFNVPASIPPVPAQIDGESQRRGRLMLASPGERST